jgi:hypothetical protein
VSSDAIPLGRGHGQADEGPAIDAPGYPMSTTRHRNDGHESVPHEGPPLSGRDCGAPTGQSRRRWCQRGRKRWHAAKPDELVPRPFVRLIGSSARRMPAGLLAATLDSAVCGKSGCRSRLAEASDANRVTSRRATHHRPPTSRHNTPGSHTARGLARTPGPPRTLQHERTSRRWRSVAGCVVWDLLGTRPGPAVVGG